jgi:hypothetical protein
MKLRFLVPILALGFAAAAAQAQVGLYFNPVVTRISNSTADTGPFAFLGSGNTSQTFGGVVFGGYYDFMHSPKFDVGVDMRDAIEHGNNAAINSFMVGARVAFKLNNPRLRPYVEVAVGDGHTRSPLSPVHVNNLEVNGFVGADYALNRHIDFRAFEIGYGTVKTISTATYNSTVSIPSARLLNYSTGFVFRFGGGAKAAK